MAHLRVIKVADMMRTQLPVIMSPRGTRHAVWASGRSADGSLFVTQTVCGLDVWIIDRWPEQEARVVTCGNCQRIIESLGYEPKSSV